MPLDRTLTRPAGKPLMPNARRRRRESGLTLLELLVVLIILGLVAALAVPQVMQYLGSAKSKTARIEIDNLAATLDLYRLDAGRYPTQQEGLRVLLEPPADGRGWNGPYLKKRDMLTDPWGRPYHYRIPGRHGAFDLYSLGADNAEGGDGENKDVGNW